MSSIALFAALGLLIGSFVNVLIYRLPLMIEASDQLQTARFNLAWPASHCPHCKQSLRIWHNIPLLSFLLLKGRCAFCHQRISHRYPLVECANALVWAACAWHWGADWTGWAWAMFGSLLLALTVIDAQTSYLPDVLTQGLLWLGLLVSALGLNPLPVHDAVLGAACGYASLWLVASAFEGLTGKVGMGAGDFKLLAALGAWLGAWMLIPLVFLASTVGAFIGLTLMATHRMRRHDYLPFGPFLAVSASLLAWLGSDTVLGFMSHSFFA